MAADPIENVPSTLKLVFISDLHTLSLPLLPRGDILFVTGDLSEGRPSQLQARLAELVDQRQKCGYEYVVVIAGNHDRALDAKCDERDAALFDDFYERLAVREAFRNTRGIVYWRMDSRSLR